MSSIEMAGVCRTLPFLSTSFTPAKCSVAYSSIEACPAESTKRSRFSHFGSAGSYFRKYCHSENITGARPMGAPGCPEFAFCTASIARVRIVLMHSVSRLGCFSNVCSVTIFCWLTMSPSRVRGYPLSGVQGLDAPPAEKFAKLYFNSLHFRLLSTLLSKSTYPNVNSRGKACRRRLELQTYTKDASASNIPHSCSNFLSSLDL